MKSKINNRLARQLTTTDAVAIGMSAMIGSGIFVAIGPAAASAGSGVLLGLLIAAGVAYCNATSSAQLAAIYPESGGTYVYGRQQLGPFWGWLAGWAFVVGKLASCAAAALTFGFYINPSCAKVLGVAAVVLLTVVNYLGIKKTSVATRVMIIVVLCTLATVVFTSILGGQINTAHLKPVGSLTGILGSAAIMFFAFAGYARIATLGEEVLEPRTTIPKAIILALIVTLAVYLTVTAGVLLVLGPEKMAQSPAPLAEAVSLSKFSMLTPFVRLGAAVATLSVLLSLMAGISRTIFAMASNRELPQWFCAVHPRYKVPHRAEFVVAVIISLVVISGDVRGAIGFSAFTILVYYAITNACVFSLPPEKRLWPLWLAVIGLLSCILLGFNLPGPSLATGGGIILIGAGIYFLRMKLLRP